MLTNSRGTWFVNQTPGNANVHRDFGPLTVSCHKNGYRPAHKVFISRTKPMAFGNVLFGGAVGAGVDMADGAAYDYPSKIIIPMKKR
jgi:hypothetical protein